LEFSIPFRDSRTPGSMGGRVNLTVSILKFCPRPK
jgi:hypothetical protein